MNALGSFTGVVAAAGDHEHWWVWAPFFWVLWLVILVTVVWLLTRRRPWRNGGDRPKAILAERLARGDISIEEFRERIAELKQSPS
jgi:putative membrane protein